MILSKSVHKPSLTIPPQLSNCDCVKQWSVRDCTVVGASRPKWSRQVRAMPACYLHQKLSDAPKALAILILLKVHQHCLQQCCSYPWMRWSCSCSWSLPTSWASLQRLCSHARLILRYCTDAAVATGGGGSQGHQRQLLSGLLTITHHQRFCSCINAHPQALC